MGLQVRMVAVRAAASIAILTRECPLHKAVELAQTDEAPEVSPSFLSIVGPSITAYLTEIPLNIDITLKVIIFIYFTFTLTLPATERSRYFVRHQQRHSCIPHIQSYSLL